MERTVRKYDPICCCVYLNSTVVLVCVECPSSTYNNNNSKPVCSSCPYGRGDKNWVEIITSVAINTAFLLKGGICPGGSVVMVKQYYWQDGTSYKSGNAPQIYPCPKEINTCCQSKDGCSIDEQCKNGTTGALCAQCSDSNYFIWLSTCVPCRSAAAGYFIGLVAIAVVISVVILFSPRFHGVYISNLVFSYQVLALVVSVSSQLEEGSLNTVYLINLFQNVGRSEKRRDCVHD